jgi:hypothetical protein
MLNQGFLNHHPPSISTNLDWLSHGEVELIANIRRRAFVAHFRSVAMSLASIEARARIPRAIVTRLGSKDFCKKALGTSRVDGLCPVCLTDFSVDIGLELAQLRMPLLVDHLALVVDLLSNRRFTQSERYLFAEVIARSNATVRTRMIAANASPIVQPFANELVLPSICEAGLDMSLQDGCFVVGAISCYLDDVFRRLHLLLLAYEHESSKVRSIVRNGHQVNESRGTL